MSHMLNIDSNNASNTQVHGSRYIANRGITYCTCGLNRPSKPDADKLEATNQSNKSNFQTVNRFNKRANICSNALLDVVCLDTRISLQQNKEDKQQANKSSDRQLSQQVKHTNGQASLTRPNFNFLPLGIICPPKGLSKVNWITQSKLNSILNRRSWAWMHRGPDTC